MSVGFNPQSWISNNLAGSPSMPLPSTGLAASSASGGIASAAGNAGGLLGKIGGGMQGLSSVLGPAMMVANVGNALYGAYKQAQHNKNLINDLTMKEDEIRGQMKRNNNFLESNLNMISEDASNQVAQVGEEIGENLSAEGEGLGQIINSGKGLLTGQHSIEKQKVMDNAKSASEKAKAMIDFTKGQESGTFINQHDLMRRQNEQSLLSISDYKGQLQQKDSFWENLIG